MSETSAPGPGADNLEPEFEKQLAEEGFALEGREKPEVEKPEPVSEKKSDQEKKPDESKKSEEDKKEEGDGKKPDEKQSEKGSENWRDAIARRRQEQAKSGGKEKSESEKPEPLKPNTEKKEDAPKTAELTAQQKTFAEKYGIDPEDIANLFPPAKVEEIQQQGLSKEDQALMDTIRGERDSLLIEKGFNADFETNVLPLLKEEYPDISPEKVEEARKQILEKIKTDEYSRTPLDVVYRGDKTFREFVPKKNNGVDNGSRVPAKGASGKVYDFDKATEDDIKQADFPFQEYSEFMAKKGKA